MGDEKCDKYKEFEVAAEVVVLTGRPFDEVWDFAVKRKQETFLPLSLIDILYAMRGGAMGGAMSIRYL